MSQTALSRLVVSILAGAAVLASWIPTVSVPHLSGILA